MAVLALLPSLARALQVAPLAIAVCGTAAPLPGGTSDGAMPAHCPLCSQVFDGLAGPPAAERGVARTTAAACGVAPAATAAPPQRLAWSIAPARAPPSSSC